MSADSFWHYFRQKSMYNYYKQCLYRTANNIKSIVKETTKRDFDNNLLNKCECWRPGVIDGPWDSSSNKMVTINDNPVVANAVNNREVIFPYFICLPNCPLRVASVHPYMLPMCLPWSRRSIASWTTSRTPARWERDRSRCDWRSPWSGPCRVCQDPENQGEYISKNSFACLKQDT